MWGRGWCRALERGSSNGHLALQRGFMPLNRTVLHSHSLQMLWIPHQFLLRNSWEHQSSFVYGSALYQRFKPPYQQICGLQLAPFTLFRFAFAFVTEHGLGSHTCPCFEDAGSLGLRSQLYLIFLKLYQDCHIKWNETISDEVRHGAHGIGSCPSLWFQRDGWNENNFYKQYSGQFLLCLKVNSSERIIG